MASQPVHSPSRLSTAEFDSYIRGYHVYQVVWTPVVGEMLLLKREPTNAMDVSAVAVCKENDIVGHVPFNNLENRGCLESADTTALLLNDVTSNYVSSLKQSTLDHFITP